MANKISFTNLSSAQFKQWLIICLLLGIVGVLLYFIWNYENAAYMLWMLAIIILALFNLKNVWARNAVTYTVDSITFKLLGTNSFGFELKEVEEVTLDDKRLQIQVKGREVISLSRKRYTLDSLNKLKLILEQSNH